MTFSELTDDAEFWEGCKGCVNYDVLQRNDRKRCLCTGMLFDPAQPMAEQPSKATPLHDAACATRSARYCI